MLTGMLKGAPATQWTIQLYTPKSGISKNFGQQNGEGPSVTLIGATSNGTTNWNWTTTTKNGSITTTKTAGKVNTTLGPYSSFRGKAGKGKVHVTGSGVALLRPAGPCGPQWTKIESARHPRPLVTGN